MKFDSFFPIIITLNFIYGNYVDIYTLGNDFQNNMKYNFKLRRGSKCREKNNKI